MRTPKGAVFPAESGKNHTEMVWVREAKADRNLEIVGAR